MTIVLTPVRNEEWILERFLTAVTQIADRIVVLDQQSTDRSVAICKQFEKVDILVNQSTNYNEAERSRILIEYIRSKYGLGHVLLAFDADELPSSDSIERKAFEQLREQHAGTALFFEKVEMLPNPPRCVRSNVWTPLGFVDDGSDFSGSLIHSFRLPHRFNMPRYNASDIKLLHLARIRGFEFEARQALYSMLENVNGTKSWLLRRSYYSPRNTSKLVGRSKVCPEEWFTWYQKHGISLWYCESNRFNDYHLRVLEMFCQHGTRRFAFDDIWWEDWEAARAHFQLSYENLRNCRIVPPPLMLRAMAGMMSWLHLRLAALSSSMRK